MALAVLKLYKCTGAVTAGVHATETYVADGIVAFLNSDLHSIDTPTYPVGVPDSVGNSPNYSYEVWLKWVLGNDFGGYLQNFKIYGSASQPATGCFIYCGVTDTALTPQDDIATNNIAVTRQDTNYYDGTSHYLTLTVDPGDGKLNAINEKTDFFVSIFKVDNTASGAVGTMTFSVGYEEVT
jgi:hypothetical protein